MGISPTSTFNAALPYGVATLAAGALGATIALTVTSTVATIAGAVVALFSAYAFIGVIACGCTSRNTQEFQERIGKMMFTFGSFALAEILTTVAQTVIQQMVLNCLNSKRSN